MNDRIIRIGMNTTIGDLDNFLIQSSMESLILITDSQVVANIVRPIFLNSTISFPVQIIVEDKE